MKHSLLLFLSADRLHAQLMAGGQIASQRDFTDTQGDRESFSAFLQQAPKCPSYLLTDLIEEDFRHESIPHLSGSARAALLQRKFDQFYRGTPFHQATLLQRQKTGRRDDDMLFSALTNPSLIMPWLNILLTQQMPLAGIYSVPQISAPLVKNSPSNHLLLISWEKYSGLRQTYFSNHRLQISRLTPIHTGMAFNAAVTKELTRTYQYLKSLSLLPAGKTLDVLILCHAADRNELQNLLPASDDMFCSLFDIEETGRQLKIDYRFTNSDASQIFLHQLAMQRPKTHYASAEHTRFHTLWQLRRALNWGSGVVLLSSALWAGVTALYSDGNHTETEMLRQQAQRALQEAQQITQGFPVTSVPPADMKSGVTAMRKLEQYQAVPKTLLQPISAVMDLFPQIQLNALDWQSNATEPVAPNTQADVPAQVIGLKGSLLNFGNDYRGALAYLDHFQLELGKRGYQVTILARPLDVSPGGSLANQHDTEQNGLDFSLKLVWRPPL